jgi:hypothetical protein
MEFVGQCKKSLMSWQSTTESTRGSFSRKPGLAMFRLDYLSCVLTILATILVGRKSWTGLLISMVNSFVVCIIGVRTSQFGLIPANLFCVCVYAFSIRSWLRGQRAEPGAAPVAVRSRRHRSELYAGSANSIHCHRSLQPKNWRFQNESGRTHHSRAV